jgi:sigma-B regulation protein RsbU (phosphoserine phosphatase)
MRPLMFGLAAILAAVSILYGCTWMYAVRHQTAPVELGFETDFSSQNRWITVTKIYPASPAERIGLRVGDRIVALNGFELSSIRPFNEIWMRASPGDSVELTVSTPGQPGTFTLHGIFRAASPQSSHEGLARNSAQQITGLFPIFFLAVGLTVLFLRIDDRNAWLLALLFCAFIAEPGFPELARIAPGLRDFVMAYRAIAVGIFAALFYFFFSVFPTRSPLDRWFPWLKWSAVAAGIFVAAPGLRAGRPTPPAMLVAAVGGHTALLVVLVYIYGFIALGLVSLAGNAFYAPTPEARRKIRYILLGTFVGVLPVAVERAAIDFRGFQPSFWLENALTLLLFVFPLSFAYAVVKHRVLEIPLLLKRSARYLLVRRGLSILILLLMLATSAIFTTVFPHLFRVDVNKAMAIGVGFGSLLAAASARPVRRLSERVDRAFFRNAYDARRILERLAENIRQASDRGQVSLLLVSEVSEALHPAFIRAYFDTGNGTFETCGAPEMAAAVPIPAELGIVQDLARRGRPIDFSEAPGDEYRADLAAFGAAMPELLTPILGRNRALAGIIVLGPRISEEPYSGDDQRLLASVASQAGIAVENIGLAEKMAAQMDIERRAEQEMQIARQVQARLFPQTFPPLATLEYAGRCIQTRQVGGDYYDFLGRGAGRLGIVLADIAGKGISGALLMANLQANLRSQYGAAAEDLAALLKSVNNLFFENTTDDAYATMFFAEYEDGSRKLRYANCGHLAALLLRANGNLERLESTSTVLGLFSDWSCRMSELRMEAGDILLLYTDGVTEANDPHGEDYGGSRLAEALRTLRHLPIDELLDSVIAGVLKFSNGVQADDITLVVARCHERGH